MIHSLGGPRSPVHRVSRDGQRIWARRQSPVGAELARDSGGSAGEDVGWAAVIASKPAATGFFRVAWSFRFAANPLWEPSLLAIAVGLLAEMLDGPPSSRASSAPTGRGVLRGTPKALRTKNPESAARPRPLATVVSCVGPVPPWPCLRRRPLQRQRGRPGPIGR